MTSPHSPHSLPTGCFRIALEGQKPDRIPLWIMRQAGRYLPEYQEVRKEAGSFLNLCSTPDLATEVTLQPIRRFDFDAAIIFSDILVIPHALGQNVSFPENKPFLEPLKETDFKNLRQISQSTSLEPVYEALAKTREALNPQKSLIGFCGGPWTLASYMIAGHSGSKEDDLSHLRRENPSFFNALMMTLVEACIYHLDRQISAGADVVQIFESHFDTIPSDYREDYGQLLEQIATEVSHLKPWVKILLFLKGNDPSLQRYSLLKNIHGLSLHYTVDPSWAHEHCPKDVVLQGNLDPHVLVEGGESMREKTHTMLDVFSKRPYVANLGHGILPPTPIQHVEDFISYVRNFNKLGLD
jgi:uroporphyrinogen decarboxylase